MLTGKAKESFEKWYFKTDDLENTYEYQWEELYEKLSTTCLCALIIDFFDSVGYYVEIEPFLGGGEVVYYPSYTFRDEDFDTHLVNIFLDSGELYYSLSREEAQVEIIKEIDKVLNNELHKHKYS